jgi:hypothetical protein
MSDLPDLQKRCQRSDEGSFGIKAPKHLSTAVLLEIATTGVSRVSWVLARGARGGGRVALG